MGFQLGSSSAGGEGRTRDGVASQHVDMKGLGDSDLLLEGVGEGGVGI